MAGEDHLGLAHQQVGDVSCSLVFLCTHKVPPIQLLQAQHEAAQAGQEELAAVHPVRLALAHPCGRISHGPQTHKANEQEVYSPSLSAVKQSPRDSLANANRTVFLLEASDQHQYLA